MVDVNFCAKTHSLFPSSNLFKALNKKFSQCFGSKILSLQDKVERSVMSSAKLSIRLPSLHCLISLSESYRLNSSKGACKVLLIRSRASEEHKRNADLLIPPIKSISNQSLSEGVIPRTLR